MAVDSIKQDIPLRSPRRRSQEHTNVEQSKLREGFTRLPKAPTNSSSQMPNAEGMSASTTLDQNYQQASPQDMLRSHATDNFYGQHGRTGRERQTEQTPLTPETPFNLTNNMAENAFAANLKEFEARYPQPHERPVNFPPTTWQMQPLVDPSALQGTMRDEPITSDFEPWRTQSLILPSNVETVLRQDSSSHGAQLHESMTESFLQWPNQMLHSSIASNNKLPVLSASNGDKHKQDALSSKDQSMLWNSALSQIPHQVSYRPNHHYERFQESDLQSHDSFQEQQYAPPINGLPDPSDSNATSTLGGTTYTTSLATLDRQGSHFGSQVPTKRTASQRQIARTEGSYGQRRKRKELGPKRTCIKCIIDRKFANSLDMCARCAGFTAIRPLCSFTKIVDINLFRLHTDPLVCLPELGIDETVISRIEGRNRAIIRTIGINQGYGPAVLYFRVQEFDKATINFDEVPEAEQNLYSVPFAIIDLEEATRRTQTFIRRSITSYIEHILSEGDQITKLFFHLAIHIANSPMPQSDFMQKVLYFWTTARMIEGDWYFQGEEDLGLPPEKVLYDAPFIDYQFSGIIKDRILLPLQKKVLKRLDDMVYKDHKNCWLSIFVGTFVLLNTYGLLIKQQRDFARSINAPTRYSSMELIRGILHGSKVLLQHFHAIRGQKPFNDILRQGQETQDIAQSAGLEGFQILRRLAVLVQHQGQIFKELVRTDEYERDHWFTGQLFLPGWKPPNTIEHMPLAKEIVG